MADGNRCFLPIEQVSDELNMDSLLFDAPPNGKAPHYSDRRPPNWRVATTDIEGYLNQTYKMLANRRPREKTRKTNLSKRIQPVFRVREDESALALHEVRSDRETNSRSCSSTCGEASALAVLAVAQSRLRRTVNSERGERLAIVQDLVEDLRT
jgi:hypothetical protein